MGSTKDVSFYKYRDCKELFIAIKNNQTGHDEAIKNKISFK